VDALCLSEEAIRSYRSDGGDQSIHLPASYLAAAVLNRLGDHQHECAILQCILSVRCAGHRACQCRSPTDPFRQRHNYAAIRKESALANRLVPPTFDTLDGHSNAAINYPHHIATSHFGLCSQRLSPSGWQFRACDCCLGRRTLIAITNRYSKSDRRVCPGSIARRRCLSCAPSTHSWAAGQSS